MRNKSGNAGEEKKDEKEKKRGAAGDDTCGTKLAWNGGGTQSQGVQKFFCGFFFFFFNQPC